MGAQQISQEKAAQRTAQLAGDEWQYRLRKACMARAVALFEAVEWLVSPNTGDEDKYPEIYQLLDDIEQEAENEAE